MNSSATAFSPTGRPADPPAVDGMQALRTGLDLARASQLTMIRLQLGLHKSNRRAVMQALDDLLDLDAEMGGVMATLAGGPACIVDDTALSGFIGLQKAAIAAEKHALMGGDRRSGARPITGAAVEDLPEQPVQAAADDEIAVAEAAVVELPAPISPAVEDVASDDRAGGRRWMPVLALAIVVVVVVFGVVAWLWPPMLDALNDIASRGLALVTGSG